MKKRLLTLVTIGVLSSATLMANSIIYASETDKITEKADSLPGTTNDDIYTAVTMELINEDILPEDTQETSPDTSAEIPSEVTSEPTPEPSPEITPVPEVTSEPEITAEVTPIPEEATNPDESIVMVPTAIPETDSQKSISELTQEPKPESKPDESEEPKAESKMEDVHIDPVNYPPANVTENTVQIYQYLTNQMRLNHAAACGVLANIQCESDFSPYCFGDGGTSYGICQWHNGRFSNLIAFCNSNGLDYHTVYGQLNFLNYELESSYPGVLSYIKSVPDTSEGAYNAAYYWCAHFEIPDKTEMRAAQRGNLAVNEYFPRSFVTHNNEDDPAYTTVRNIRTKMELSDRVMQMRVSRAYNNLIANS